MTLAEARREARCRGRGWTIRRDARRLGGWYVRSPVPRISPAEWARRLRGWRRCPYCLRWGVRLVREHDHRTGRLRLPSCGPCNLAFGLLAKAGVRTPARVQKWARRVCVMLELRW